MICVADNEKLVLTAAARLSRSNTSNGSSSSSNSRSTTTSSNSNRSSRSSRSSSSRSSSSQWLTLRLFVGHYRAVSGGVLEHSDGSEAHLCQGLLQVHRYVFLDPRFGGFERCRTDYRVVEDE